MNRVGIIAPVKKLDEYCITRVQYCMPELMSNEEYKEFYLRKAREGHLIIVDCVKVSWKRRPEDLSKIKEVLDLFKEGTELLVVTPSQMFDAYRTARVADEFIKSLGSYAYAGCVEGTTKEEVVECKNSLRAKVSMYAVPGHIIKTQEGVRYDKELLWIENHLRIEEVEGSSGILVTSLPVRLGLEGRILSDYLPSPPTLDYYADNFTWDMVVRRNIKEALNFYG